MESEDTIGFEKSQKIRTAVEETTEALKTLKNADAEALKEAKELVQEQKDNPQPTPELIDFTLNLKQEISVKFASFKRTNEEADN